MEDKLGGKVLTKLIGLRKETYTYLMMVVEIKKAKGTKQCVMEVKIRKTVQKQLSLIIKEIIQKK